MDKRLLTPNFHPSISVTKAYIGCEGNEFSLPAKFQIEYSASSKQKHVFCISDGVFIRLFMEFQNSHLCFRKAFYLNFISYKLSFKTWGKLKIITQATI